MAVCNLKSILLGWLEKWKARQNIKRMAICGETEEVQGETVESWKECLPGILCNYTAEDVEIWRKRVVSGDLA